jgi:PEP-CTERM motif
MTRFRLAWAATLVGALVAPSVTLAYFPPTVGQPPIQVTSVPPDPFKPPTAGGLGEPSAPEPPPGPSVQTPEPASMLTALVGAGLALGYGLRRKMAVNSPATA